KEQTRDATGSRRIEDLFRDLAYAWRSLRRSPGLVIISVLSLGLGIGANSALFTVIAGVFLQQPSMSDPDRFVAVEPGNSDHLSYLNLRDLRNSMIFADAVGFRSSALNARAGDRIDRVNA